MSHMTDKELNNLLNRAKDSTLFGGDFSIDKQEELGQRIWQELGFEENSSKQRYGWQDYAQYILQTVSGSVLRPVVMSVVALVLVVGGFAATVNASHSIPGDILYPVKLASERIQIVFSTNSQERAILHTEFASRRLHEAAEVAKESGDENSEQVKQAVSRFKVELASANSELQDIKINQPEDVADLAAKIEQTTDEYESILAGSDLGENDSKEVIQEVESAIEVVAETEDAAIDALVENNETTPDPFKERNIERAFQSELTSINLRVATNLGRLEVIKGVLVGAEFAPDRLEDIGLSISEAKQAVSLNGKDITEAVDIFAAGGHRRAFEILNNISSKLTASEEIITGLEIEISTGIINQKKSSLEESKPEASNGEIENFNSSEDVAIDAISEDGAIEVVEF